MKSRTLLVAFGLVFAIPGLLAILPSSVGPVTLPEESIALAYEEDPRCPSGGFCGTLVDNGAGCGFVPCCPQGQNLCGTFTQAGTAFPRFVASESGHACYSFTGPEATYCTMNVCAGSDLCNASCVMAGLPIPFQKKTPVYTGPCVDLL